MDHEARSPKSWLLVLCVAAAIVALYALLAPSLNKTSTGSANTAVWPPVTMSPKVPGVDLLGQVLTTNGAPITNASIFIYTAGPRSGPGFI